MARAFIVLAVALALVACDEADEGLIYGYAEGRFRLLAPESEGRIVALEVEEGQDVEAGAIIAQVGS